MISLHEVTFCFEGMKFVCNSYSNNLPALVSNHTKNKQKIHSYSVNLPTLTSNHTKKTKQSRQTIAYLLEVIKLLLHLLHLLQVLAHLLSDHHVLLLRDPGRQLCCLTHELVGLARLLHILPPLVGQVNQVGVPGAVGKEKTPVSRETLSLRQQEFTILMTLLGSLAVPAHHARFQLQGAFGYVKTRNISL